ncbi:hypothetical protein F5B21DRAFT_468437 [Xylaria acuta]|nr:hypothetical protein F5B21DRAFT_468437 [Xylaria acuta]
MIDRTSVSTYTQTTGLVFSASSTPNRPAPSSAQPIHSNSNPAPSPSPLISTQSSDVHSSVLSTSSSLLSSNMTTSAPSALSLLQTAGFPPNTLLPLQIQANPILQQHTQPQFGWFGRHSLVVCVVCGGICKVTDFADNFADDLDGFEDNETPDWMRPILAQAKPGYLEWQKQLPATRRSNHDDADLIEQIQPTAFLGGSRGMKLGSETLSLNTMDSLIKIPVHRACFEIAQIFCKGQTRSSNGFRGADGGAPGSIPQLYEVWCKRAIASNPSGLMSKPILEPSLYSGAPAPLCETMADYWRTMHRSPSLGRFLAYPLDIPDLTDMVVGSNLQTMDCKARHARKKLDRLLDRIQDMPQEIADQILGGLEPFEENRGPPLRPTRVLPPIWWKRMLLSGKLIPWLWDLNENDLLRYRVKNFYSHNVADAVRELERGEYVFDENMWDWELLCRQLAQFNVTEKGGLLEGKSERLWNRRRIWKLLDAARLGHVRFS